jgi:hypothetical protein
MLLRFSCAAFLGSKQILVLGFAVDLQVAI